MTVAERKTPAVKIEMGRRNMDCFSGWDIYHTEMIIAAMRTEKEMIKPIKCNMNTSP